MDTRNWNICFICKTEKNEDTADPALSIKLRGQPNKLEACYQELLDNSSELNELGELPSFVVVDDILGGGVGGGGASNRIELMKTNHAVWHKNCRSGINR